MRSHHHRLRYPYQWSADVVHEFVEKHSRVVVFVAKSLGYSPKAFRDALINTLMRNEGQWNRVRDTLKKIDRCDMFDDLRAVKGEYLRAYLTFVSMMVMEEEENIEIRWDILDNVLEWGEN